MYVADRGFLLVCEEVEVGGAGGLASSVGPWFLEEED